MKKLVSNYSFNAAAKQIILSDYTSIDLESLLLITNVTNNTIIYNFSGQGKGATAVGNILTLDFDTTSMSDNDNLQIFIDDGQANANQETLEALKEVINYLKLGVQQTKTLATQDANNRQRVVVEGGSGLGVNATQSGTWTINTQTIFGEAAARSDLARNTFANGIRSKLIF